jgi:small subunit ribosomal protein S20
MEESLAHHKSAKKRIKTNEKRRIYNRSIKSRVKTYIRYFNESVEEVLKDASKAGELKESVSAKLNKAVSELHKASSKGVLHKNTAGRKVGRLTNLFDKTFQN